MEASTSPKGVTRLSAREYAYHLIKSLEGYREKAYRDHKQRSIGFGTKSYKGQVLTKEEIYAEYQKQLTPRVQKIQQEHPKLSTCKQAALTSLFWNCPVCYYDIIKKGITEKRRKSYLYAGDIFLRGLITRRNQERSLYTTC